MPAVLSKPFPAASARTRALACALLITGLAGPGPAAAQSAETDLCAGLITDKAPHPKTASPRPAKGVAFKDPVFGTRVMRITDVAKDFDSDVAKPMYSTIPAWNIDESRLVLFIRDKGHALFDGRTYAFIRMLDVEPADIEQLYWDAKDPDVLWFNYVWEMSGESMRQFTRYRVSTNQKTVVYDYPRAGKPRGYKVDNGEDPQYPAWDMSLWGVRIEMDKGSEKFSLSMPAKLEGRRVFNDGPTPMACPSGRCMWVPDDKGSRLVDPKSLETVRRLKLWGDEHGNLGLNAAGQDFFASVQFDSKPAGTLIVENLQTGVVKPIISTANGYPYPPTSTHISAVAFRAPGWVAVSAVGKPAGQRVLDQEVLLANVDTGKVCRIAHHHSFAKEGRSDYWGEPHVTISPSGTRAVFASDWENSSSVDTYVVELPAYKPAR
jgi:hypothetical protein